MSKELGLPVMQMIARSRDLCLNDFLTSLQQLHVIMEFTLLDNRSRNPLPL